MNIILKRSTTRLTCIVCRTRPQAVDITIISIGNIQREVIHPYLTTESCTCSAIGIGTCS